MRQKEKQRAFWAAVMTVVFIGLACWASKADYNHTTVAEMSDTTYDKVMQELADTGNSDPTEAEIVKWWEEHHR